MKKTSIQEYAKALYEVTSGRDGATLEQAIKAFAELLLKSNQIKKAPAIIDAYIAYAQKQAGQISIEITTARPVDNASLEAIKKAFGTAVVATHKVNPAIIGGMVVKTEDTILDASLKTQLQNLQAHLA